MREKIASGRERGAAKHRAPLDALVAKMYADYQAGMSFAGLGRKYHRDRRSCRELMTVRGYKLRPLTVRMADRLPNGQIKPDVPKTGAEITALIERETKLRVPVELKLEWRKWSWERRGDFIRRLRARLNTGKDRPETPFSANVDPFDYASPRAWEICNTANRGTDSRNAVVKMNISSQGVIWDGALWFWTWRTGYLRMGQWTPEAPRQLLNWAVWEKANGRKVPRKGYIVVFADGNPNNFAPENLLLKKRETELRENQAAALTRKSREQLTVLMKRSNRKGDETDANNEGIWKALHK